MLEDMKHCVVIKLSDSPWLLHVVLLWKNKVLCFCVDYSKLNTTNKGFDHTQNKLTGTMCFSTLDLKDTADHSTVYKSYLAQWKSPAVKDGTLK
jgi:hypothetical protein